MKKIAFFLVSLVNVIVLHTQDLNYKNPSFSFEQRVDILIQQMTLEEKVSQLMDRSPAISRLGIPEYNWWNEGLHGVARAGLATVFPQAIGMAATFNDSLIYLVATAISDEFRAKYNDAIKKENRKRYYGLTVWSPTINIFRDPRWGRGQETYGEDPYLTSKMGVMFVKGLQSDHPKYFKTIATPKHFVVHSGPEKLRHSFDVNVSEYDFLDTYTPAFKACIVEAKAFSIMGAYNRFRGESCSASDFLLNELLRNRWGFNGYVVSDCDAIADIYQHHKIKSTPYESAALGLKNGCDLNCGDTYKFLIQAIEKGLVTEKDVDQALKRLMLARMKLGMFDEYGSTPWDTFSMARVDNEYNRKLALKTAQQSIVLLKNNGVLPLNRKTIKKIAVVGPNAHNAEVMYGNYHGIPSYAITPYQGISNAVFQKTTVYYHPLNGLINPIPKLQIIGQNNYEYNGNKGLKVEIYNNINFQGDPIFKGIDTSINISWHSQSSYRDVPANNISIRWEGNIIVDDDGDYFFSFTGDDGYRVWIDGKLMTNQWKDQAPHTSMFQVKLTKGKKYSLKVEYYQSKFGAVAQLKWNKYSEKQIEEVLKKLKDFDVIVYVGGLSPELEGEEMPVNFDGFDGGDRTRIELPTIQTEILKKLKKTGKPVIFVVMSGSEIAMNWEHKNIDAILLAWYPGQEGGRAIADVLFGDYNPAGRLPVTFYASTQQLPPFDDYSMKNRTYRYFKSEPLYPFGYGLSYTSFKYTNLVLPSTSDTRKNIKVKVTVQNIGGKAGEEVVQLYIKHPTCPYPTPIHALKGFKRIFLKAGDYTTVEFELTPQDLSVLDNTYRYVVLSGDVEIFVGSMQPSPKNIKEKLVLVGTVTKTGENYYLTE